MAAGSANPKRKKISLSLMRKEAFTLQGVVGECAQAYVWLCSSFRHIFGWESGLCSNFLISLAALSLSLRPCVFKMCI